MPERNNVGQTITEEALYVIPADKALRRLPSPMAGVKAKQSGAPDLVLFRLWHIAARQAGGGDLRDANGELVLYYVVRELPVSEVHNGSIGYAVHESGDHHFQPTHWLAAGWRLMREIPSDWREHNAKVDALAARREQERNGTGPSMADQIANLADAIRSGKPIEVTEELRNAQRPEPAVAAGDAAAGASGDRAAAAGARGRGARAAAS